MKHEYRESETRYCQGDIHCDSLNAPGRVHLVWDPVSPNYIIAIPIKGVSHTVWAFDDVLLDNVSIVPAYLGNTIFFQPQKCILAPRTLCRFSILPAYLGNNIFFRPQKFILAPCTPCRFKAAKTSKTFSHCHI